MERITECGTLSALSVMKVAIEITNISGVKSEIFCSPADIRKTSECNEKQIWNIKIENKVTITLRKLGLPEQLQRKVLAVVLAIGMRMRIWAVYHEINLGLSRQYCLNFLNSSFFNQHGIIDDKRTAKELIDDKNLSIKQRYTLACYYCLTDYIPVLYGQLLENDKDMIKKSTHQSNNPRAKPTALLNFWSCYMMGVVDKIKGRNTLEQCRLNKAIASGSKAAVEYCLEETNLINKEAIIVAAVEAVKNRITAENDWIVFRDPNFDDSKKIWVPSDYYVDIATLLLSKMREDQRIEFLKRDIEGRKYRRESFGDHRRSRILEYYLSWPYQDHFMKTAELMWEFIPERNYAFLLLKVCDKIDGESEENIKYGEEKGYDYRGILKKLWCRSPERFKRYVFNNKEYYKTACVQLFIKLLTLKEFTEEDRKIIELILLSATDKEKGNIISSKKGSYLCIEVMKEKRFGMLDEFVLGFFLSKEQAINFKKELIFSNMAISSCTELIREDKLELVDEFVNCCLNSQEEIKEYKKNFALKEGTYIFTNLISDITEEEIVDEQGLYEFGRTTFKGGKWEEAEMFLTWCFSSEEEISDYKKKLHEISAAEIHFNLIKSNQWEEAETFFAWLGLSSEEIKKLKKDTLLCHEDANDEFFQLVFRKDGDEKFRDYGSKQEAIELLLRWYLSDRETLLEFKNEFKTWYPDEREDRTAMYEIFDLAVAQRLIDLDEGCE